MKHGGIPHELASRVVAAVGTAFDVEIGLDQALIRHATPGRGDYQSNAAMSLARRLGRPSREVAEKIVSTLGAGEMLAPPEVAGPGFINFTLRRDWLERHTERLLTDRRLGVPEAEPRQRVVLDYSAPNMAKEMHVGHLRPTIIGDCLARLLSWAGHEVIRQNHLGDWGTPFGMLVEHLVDEGRGEAAELDIGDLTAFYQQARAKFDTDSAFADRARRRVVALQSGDPATLTLWGHLIAESRRHLRQIYDLLGVLLTPDDDRGESFYNDRLPDIAGELSARGLAEISDGALCAFPQGFVNRGGDRMALIVRKSDGGYTYDTTDLATIRFRARELKADHLVYVVGAPQRLHFELIFALAREAGWLPEAVRTTHVSFGSILGEDGRMMRTRSGELVKLADLLQSAIERASAQVADRSELDQEERISLARSLGVGAIKYADLSGDREKDYVFSLDRMLAMDGNTSVYLQYANARIRSILRKADDRPLAEDRQPVILDDPAERALALKLAQFPEAVEQAAELLEPHRLCTYLFETAVGFTTFYERCPVLAAEASELRRSRLGLCALTSRTLVQGLELLGIDAPERM